MPLFEKNAETRDRALPLPLPLPPPPGTGDTGVGDPGWPWPPRPPPVVANSFPRRALPRLPAADRPSFVGVEERLLLLYPSAGASCRPDFSKAGVADARLGRSPGPERKRSTSPLGEDVAEVAEVAAAPLARNVV